MSSFDDIISRPLADLIEPDPLKLDSQQARAARLRIALDLADAGMDMMWQSLRRRHPGESVADIDRRLLEWLRHRPGAEFGDAWGRPALESLRDA